MKLRTVLIVVALLTLTVSSMAGQGTSAQASPAAWSMFMGDQSHSSRSAFDTSNDPGQAVNWVPRWATGNASIVISSRGTYFATTGSILYRLSPDNTPMNKYAGNGSLMGTPAIGWNDTAYFGSLDRFIFALDGNGTVWWNFNTSAPVWSSPTIAENSSVYVTSAGLMSFTLDGRLNWRVLQNVTSRSSPAVSADGTIYFGAEDGRLYAVDQTGSVLWSRATGGAIRSSPSVDSAGNVRVGSEDGILYCFDHSGSLIWAYDTGAPIESSAGIRADNWTMILTGNGSLTAIDPSGKYGWTLKLDGYNVTRSLAIDSSGECYVGSDTTMYSVQPDGKVRWTYRISTGSVGSPAITKNGTVVFGSSTGLFELGHVDEGNEWLVLAAAIVPPLVLCAILILAAKRLRHVKTLDDKEE